MQSAATPSGKKGLEIGIVPERPEDVTGDSARCSVKGVSRLSFWPEI